MFGNENFPYTNFHDLNMDWIIKIAKDFLDQYTHLQETIDTGLSDLDTKAAELEALLQAWYDTHSEDIANELAEAIQSLDGHLATTITAFNNAAEQKAAQTIQTIPADYTALSNQVLELDGRVEEISDITNLLNPDTMTGGYISDGQGTITASAAYITTDYIPVQANVPITISPRARKVLTYYPNRYPLVASYTDVQSTDPYTYTPTIDGFVRVTLFVVDVYKQINYGSSVQPYTPYGYYVLPNKLLTYNVIDLDNVQNASNAVGTKIDSTTLNIKTLDTTVQNTAVVLRTTRLQNNTKYNFSCKIRSISGSNAILWVRPMASDLSLGNGFLILRPEAGKTYFGSFTTQASNFAGIHIQLSNSVSNIDATLEEMMVYETTTEQTEPFVKPLENTFYDTIARARIDYKMGHMPLSSMPNYIAKTLAYRPIGVYSKPYICLVSDDGEYELASYTIPMLIQKNVPCTFALWSTSHALNANLATVLDAINNHGCEVAQHGEREWTSYTEDGLVQFFDLEQANFARLGITPKGAAYPSLYVNDMVKAVAGGRFGVVRCGYDGHVGVCENYYQNYAVGPRDNIYSITAYNPKGHTLEWMKAQLDYCIANNYLCMIYFHDWDLGDGASDRLEAIIDYAKANNVEFVTLSQVERLT